MPFGTFQQSQIHRSRSTTHSNFYYPSRYKAALQSGINHFSWATQLQVVCARFMTSTLHHFQEIFICNSAKKLKICLHSLQPSDQLKEQMLWHSQACWLARPVLIKRVKKSGIITLSQILHKIGYEEMLSFVNRVDQGGTATERGIQQLFIQIKQTSRGLKKNQKLFFNCDYRLKIRAFLSGGFMPTFPGILNTLFIYNASVKRLGDGQQLECTKNTAHFWLLFFASRLFTSQIYFCRLYSRTQ